MFVTGVILFFLVGTVLVVSTLIDWSFAAQENFCLRIAPDPDSSNLALALSDPPDGLS